MTERIKRPVTPKCTVNSMMKVIRRQSELSEAEIKPEHNLIFAIINGAVLDLTDKTYRHSALSFFDDELFGTYCAFVGLCPIATRSLLVTGGFI